MAKISQNIQIAFIARLYLQLCISYSLRGIGNYILLLIHSIVICEIVKLTVLKLKLILKMKLNSFKEKLIYAFQLQFWALASTLALAILFSKSPLKLKYQYTLQYLFLSYCLAQIHSIIWICCFGYVPSCLFLLWYTNYFDGRLAFALSSSNFNLSVILYIQL